MILPARAKVMLAVLALGLAFAGGWTSRGWKEAAGDLKQAHADTKAVTAVVGKTQAAAVATEDVGRTVEIRREAARVITREILKEVPVYVTVEADRQCDVPVGFVRLHDAAAQGTAPAFPDGAGQSPDAPSGVELSTVAATVADNYGVARDLREQVLGWQAWYAAQVEAWNTPAPALKQADRPVGQKE